MTRKVKERLSLRDFDNDFPGQWPGLPLQRPTTTCLWGCTIGNANAREGMHRRQCKRPRLYFWGCTECKRPRLNLNRCHWKQEKPPPAPAPESQGTSPGHGTLRVAGHRWAGNDRCPSCWPSFPQSLPSPHAWTQATPMEIVLAGRSGWCLSA